MSRWMCSMCLLKDEVPPSKLVIRDDGGQTTMYLCQECAEKLGDVVAKDRDTKLAGTDKTFYWTLTNEPVKPEIKEEPVNAS